MKTNKYFVYLYRHPITYEPFYVGYGHDKRHLSHLKEAKNPNAKSNKHKLNKIRKIIRSGLSPIIEMVDCSISHDKACELEIFLISLIGRADTNTGTLTNKTAGGDGVINMSNKTRKIISKLRKGKITAKDHEGNILIVDSNDPRWLAGELVGINKNIKINTPNQKGYILAKDANNVIFRVKADDPKWISGELKGINKGKKPNQNVIDAARRRKGVPHSKSHNDNVSKAFKGAKWIHNFTTGQTKRLTNGNQIIPDGFTLVSGPHKLTIIE